MQKQAGLFFLMVFLPLSFLFSQTDTSFKKIPASRLCEIKMHDGTLYKGHIEKQDSLIYLKSSSGVLVIIPKRQVTSIDVIKGHSSLDTNGSLQIHVPGIAHYYYTTTSNAFLFKKGEIYGSTSYLFLGNINYAFNRNFSLGVSTSIIGVPMGLHPKANFEIGHKLYAGFEGIAGSLMYVNPKTYGLGGVGKLTFGDENRNYTFYVGYFDAEYWVLPRKRGGRRGTPVTLVPGNYYVSLNSGFLGAAISAKLSARTFFTADIFAFPYVSVYTASIGLRTNAKQKMSWIWGFQFIKNMNPAVNRVFTIPYFGFSYRLFS